MNVCVLEREHISIIKIRDPVNATAYHGSVSRTFLSLYIQFQKNSVRFASYSVSVRARAEHNY